MIADELQDLVVDVSDIGPDGHPEPTIPNAVLLGELQKPTPGDGKELISNRGLNRRGSIMLVGPTGAGKSALVTQCAAHWATGKPCFGLRPTGAYRSLIIQAENDEGDLYEMREGIFTGCEFTQAERDEAERNVIISTVDDVVGFNFIGQAQRLLAKHRPDILFIDPLLAYVGADISKQEVASQFLREWLTPTTSKANCGLVLAHHPPKPKQDSGQEKSTDDAYYGAGSAELFNWARAVIVLKPTKAHGIFELKLAKRGRRFGWLEADGATPCYKRTIAHGENGLIYWRELSEVEAAKGASTPGKSKEDLLALVPMEGTIEKLALISKGQAKGIGRDKARGFIAELVAAELLYDWRTKRAGTNPRQDLCRKPQPRDA